MIPVPEHTSDGWFSTGDVATLDGNGYVRLTDRTKDIVKSGGEWISSIDLENIAVGHPSVAEAAVIGVPHSRWGERPLLIVVREPGTDLDPKDMLAYFDGKVARWWKPDAVAFVDQLPHTATGKLLKTRLRGGFLGIRTAVRVVSVRGGGIRTAVTATAPLPCPAFPGDLELVPQHIAVPWPWTATLSRPHPRRPAAESFRRPDPPS